MTKIRTDYIFVILLYASSLIADPLEKVSLQLNWLDQFQFAGYYVAKEKGFYEEAGLDVDIKKFQVGIDPLEDILKEKATYGIGRSSLFVEKGKGKEVVLLAAILQSSPSVLLARKDSGIQSVSDFRGRSVMMTGSVEAEVAIRAMMNKAGISLEEMTVLNHSSDLNDLITGKTDLMASYLSNEPYQLNNKGIDYIIFDPKEHGFDFYGDILFTCQYELTHHKGRARNFTQASLRGWKYAFDHIEETARLIYEKYNGQQKSLDAYIYEGRTLKKLAYYKHAKLGELEEHKLTGLYNVYNVMGLIKNEIDIDTFYLKPEELNTPSFTKGQRGYLEEKEEINVCTFSNFMPLHGVEGDKDTGIVSDYLKIISEKTGLRLNVLGHESMHEIMGRFQRGECDLIPLIRENSDRQKLMRFTQPYAKGALVIATKKEQSFIADLADLEGKTVGIQSGTVAAEELRAMDLGIELIEFTTKEEGLEAVDKGEIYGFFGDLFSTSYAVQNDYVESMKISGRFGADMKAYMAVRKDDVLLAGIIDKVLNSISEEQKRMIKQRWLSVEYEEIVDYKLMNEIIALFFIISIFFIYRYRVLSKHNEELTRLSILDALTKLYNRRHLDKSLASVLELAKRYETPFSIILLDIDDFKEINDTFGHNEGDKVLISISKVLKQHSRENDVVGRWGGEEFLIICPHTKMEGARHLAELLCSMIDKELHAGDINVTASFGVAEYAQEPSVYKLITRADDALYKAKGSGKNRVVAAD